MSADRPYKFAYADPVYLGYARYYKKYHPEAHIWDDLDTHKRLIERMNDEYDGWALSLHSPSLRHILPLTPEDTRVAAWCKPFCVWLPNQIVQYTFEPVLFRGGRPKAKGIKETARRDWIAENTPMKGGLIGAKPPRFAEWVFSILNAKPGDTLDDLFPGTGIVGKTWADWISRGAANENDEHIEIGGIRKVEKKAKRR
jgi:hypothetical protein